MEWGGGLHRISETLWPQVFSFGLKVLYVKIVSLFSIGPGGFACATRGGVAMPSFSLSFFFSFGPGGFLSPKAQLVQAKVTDMHKGWDTFITQRLAILREIAKLFIEYSDTKGIEANAENFEVWEKVEVKNENFRNTLEPQNGCTEQEPEVITTRLQELESECFQGCFI